MIRLMLRAALGASLLSGAAGLVYGGDAAVGTLKIFVPVGLISALISHQLVVRRARLGGLRRQFGVVAVVAIGQMAVSALLFADLMFVSHHDAFFAVLVAAYGGLLALCIGQQMAGRSLRDLEAIRAALKAVGEGERNVRIAVRGGGELAAVAADLEHMVGQLQAEESARRRLIAAVSHDLRTPLTSLQLMASAIEDDLVDPVTRSEYLHRMSTNVSALSVLINDLFELSRLEAGDVHWSMSRVDLQELIKDTVEAMRPHADAGLVRVRAEPADASTPARANPEQIQRVLFNLIQNAIRHTPPDGSVVVHTEPGQDVLEVEVADTGEGISREDREHVFEPFSQGAARAARTDGSAGLGLAIARAIVEAHGGKIWLAEASSGTRVRFSLPVA
jgi:signal transduction histidine kinase